MADSNQIVEVKLADGRVIAFVDWTDKPLYSTIEILNGTTTQEMSLFQYVAGDNVPAFAPVAPVAQRTATELDTNMAGPGAMQSTEAMMIYAIRPEIFRRHVEDAEAPDFASPAALTAGGGEPAATPIMLAVMHMRLLMTLEISQKWYAMAGLGYFNFGAGMMAASSEANALGAAAAANYGYQGLPAQSAVRTNVVPQHIGGEEKFRVFLTFIDDGTGNGIELGQQGIEGGDNPGVEAERFARVRIYLDGLYKRPVS